MNCLHLQPGAYFKIYRFYLNADEYFEIIRLNNFFAIGVAVKGTENSKSMFFEF